MTPAAAIRTLRAAIYTRVSKDTSGRARSPREQEADARRDCERLGLSVAGVYRDNDLGASRYSAKDRPEYARLRADIEAGRVDVVVAWEASRLARDTEVFGELAKLCRKAGTQLLINGRMHDPDDPDDEFNLGLGALLAQREVASTRKRVMRALDENARTGRVHGRLQYGYRRIYDERGNQLGQEPDPTYGPVVTEMFRRIAAGETLNAVARDLNRRGVDRPTGGKWEGAHVAHIVKRQSYLGHRTHHGVITYPNAWPALVDDETWHAAQAQIGGRGAQVKAADRTARHLLSGIITCGVCGGRTTYDPMPGRKQSPLYKCHRGAHVARAAPVLDEAVRIVVVEWLTTTDADAVFAPVSDDGSSERAHDEVAALRGRLDGFYEAAIAGTITAEGLARIEGPLLAQIAEIELAAKAQATHLPADLIAVVGRSREECEAWWDGKDVEQQRGTLRALFAELALLSKRREPGLPPGALGLRVRVAGSEETHIV